MNKIGILGGTFDPVHNEHITMAERVKEELNLSALVVVPTFTPPHKSHSECAPAAAREEMLKEVFGAENVCDYEKMCIRDRSRALRAVYGENRVGAL